MAQQTINIGASPNDGTGTPLRTAFQYTNSNFSELYTAVGPSGNNIVVPGSATISGALTVGTGANAAVLKASFLGGYSVFENSAGTGNPSITFNNDLDTGIRAPSANTLVFDAGGFEQYRIASSGVFTWSDGAGGTRMTLNSTGLGVGASPSYQLHVSKSQASATTLFVDNQQNNAAASSDLWLSAYGGQWKLSVPHSATFVNPLIFKFGSTEMMRLDAAGNVGIGVQPSAWASIYKTVEFANGSSIWGQTDIPQLSLQTNAFLNSSFQWIYKTTAAASNYRQNAGAHLWFTAPSGTAGNVITFTERLRLKETGQLRFVPLASDPSGAEAGDVYYNSTSNKLKCYNGTTWNDLF